MYEYFNGKIVSIDSKNLIIDINGIGYKLEVPKSLKDNVNVGTYNIIYVEQVVSENKISIYGFINEQQKWVFNLLRNVSKIGPKIALSIVSELNTDQIVNAINTENLQILSSSPGVGSKTASRIIIELKDKVKNYIFQDSLSNDNTIFELTEVLENLGYTRYEITNHLKNLDLKGLELDEQIKIFLKTIN